MPQIERVRDISARELWNEFVLRRKPVIITNLLDDFPDRDLDAVVGRFRDAPNPELAPRGDGTETTLGEWLAKAKAGVRVPKHPDSDSYSAPSHDFPIDYTRQAKRLFALADELKTPVDRTWDRLGLTPGVKDASLVFFGFHEATGCHFDNWITQNLTAHIAGAKQWFLAPPQNIAALGPYGATVLTDPMKMPLAERDALAEVIGGYSFTVQAGETLYWPHQWLHGTWYHEPSISFVLHFGRNLFTTFFTREVYRSFYRHSILEKLYPDTAILERYQTEFRALHDVCKQEYAGPRERFLAVESVLRSLYDQLYPDRPLEALPFKFDAVRTLEEAEGERYYEGGFHPAMRNGWQKNLDAPLFNWW
jgi:hypothetical protein